MLLEIPYSCIDRLFCTVRTKWGGSAGVNGLWLFRIFQMTSNSVITMATMLTRIAMEFAALARP